MFWYFGVVWCFGCFVVCLFGVFGFDVCEYFGAWCLVCCDGFTRLCVLLECRQLRFWWVLNRFAVFCFGFP